MIVPHLRHFQSIWLVICGVDACAGELPAPVWMAAIAFEHDQPDIVMDRSALLSCFAAPYPVNDHTLLVTVEADRLVGCHIALNWKTPARIIDLLVEFQLASNGLATPLGKSLPGAFHKYGLPIASALQRSTSPAAIRDRLHSVKMLFSAMLPSLDLPRALLRGRYMAAVGRIEATGIPTDLDLLGPLTATWPNIRLRCVATLDQRLRLFDGFKLRVDAFERWIDSNSIVWPRRASGRLDLSDNTFSDMARSHSDVRILKELMSLAGFDPCSLTVGHDGRNRMPLRPFSTLTGRNAPSTKASVIGQATWLRHLIRPREGSGLALIDWCQQEFGIAAALSDDVAMQTAYRSGDPYLAFAELAGACLAPNTLAATRDRFKICALGVQYGMGTARLAQLIGRSEAEAWELLRKHRSAFPAYWRWSDAVEQHAFLTGELKSVFGWRLAVNANANPRSVRNFPLQANGAEMLRLACCLATEAGIRVCMPLHDALLIEAPLGDLAQTIAETQAFMAEASRVVLDGFELRSDVKVSRYPDRYCDPRGAAIWAAIEQAMDQVAPAHERDASCASAHTRTVSLYVSKGGKGGASD